MAEFFTQSQLENIAAWKLADESWAPIDPIEQYIRPATALLTASGRYECHIVFGGDDGLSNYYSVAVHRPLTKQELSRARHYKPYNGDGVLFYLSLMAPVGAIGRTSITIAAGMFGANPLEMDSLLDPERGIDDGVDAVLDAFRGSIYRFLDRGVLTQHLPPNIKPYEYCLCDEPWDRVFHVLFANTD